MLHAMSALAEPYTLSDAEYLSMERAAFEKSELINGVVYAMSGGTLAHSLIASNVLHELRTALGDRPCSVFNSDLRVKVGPGTYCYPDLSALCGAPEVAESDLLLNPTLVVEVLSKSTRIYDLTKKFERYSWLASLQEYVLISQEEPLIYRYNRKRQESWELLFIHDLDATLDVLSMECAIPVEKIYRQVVFNPGS